MSEAKGKPKSLVDPQAQVSRKIPFRDLDEDVFFRLRSNGPIFWALVSNGTNGGPRSIFVYPVEKNGSVSQSGTPANMPKPDQVIQVLMAQRIDDTFVKTA